jgi:PAS domain S-box-containing protein
MLEQRYKELVANIDGIVWEADARTFCFTFVSEQAVRLLGYPVKAWFEPGFWESHIHPDDRDAALAYCIDCTAKLRKHDLEYRMVAADGRTVWLHDVISVFAPQGQPMKLHGVMVDVTSRKLAEQERQAHLRFLESMDKVNRAMQGVNDLEQLMSAVLETVLTVLDCDRAWLLYPCKPEASSWSIAMERTRPEFSGLYALTYDVSMSPEVAELLRIVSDSSEPVRFGPDEEHPVNATSQRFQVQSMMCTAVRPRVAEPYVFGVHQCSRPRVWTAEDQTFFQEVGRRLADELTTLLVVRRLSESERKLADAERLAQVGYWERDFVTGLFTHSEEALRMLGLDTDERSERIHERERRWHKVIHPDDLEAVTRAVAAALGGEGRIDIEYRVRRPDGEVRTVQSRGDVIWNEAGRPSRMFGSIQDITERKRAEAQLRASEARFRTFADHATDGFYLYDVETGTFTDVNQQACESLGYGREELIGMTPLQIDAQIQADPARLEPMNAQLRDGRLLTFESIHRRKDGSTFPVEVRVRPFRDRGRLLGVALARDITERKRAEAALLESHRILNSVIEGTPDAVFGKDTKGRYTMINSAGARFLGKVAAEVIGKDDSELFSRGSSRRVMALDRRLMASGQQKTFEETLTAAGVTRTYLTTRAPLRDEHGNVTGLVGIARDITELKRMEDQFRQAQRMEAIGRLAGGIAHDFNNLLTVINGYTELALLQGGDDDPNAQLLTEILSAGERASNLTRQLLAFSRKQVLDPQVVNLNALIGRVLKILRTLIGEDVELSFHPESHLDLVRVDPGQFEQVIINLAVNARDSMPQGGQLTIETRNIDRSGEDGSADRDELRPGRYVQVAVTDSGQGMDAATKARIFEPFFTTKERGKGTGLGLAMVYGFLKQSGGYVEVDSEPGRGTTFRIHLPWAEDAVVHTTRTQDTATVPHGTETILLVEDDDAVRRFAKRTLRSHGYTVLVARDGVDALHVSEEHAGPIHLLLTDLVMPRMGGRQLTDILTRRRPDIRVLLMSGYTDETSMHSPTGPHEALLHKPFSPRLLSRKVRAILDGAADHRRPLPTGSRARPG